MLAVLGAIVPDVRLMAAGRPPTVFLHGLCSSSVTWNQTKTALETQGWTFGGALKDPFDQVTMSRYPSNADFYLLNFGDEIISNGIEGHGANLALYLRRINEYRIGSGLSSSKFTLVGHSAGGLTAAYYLKSSLYRGDVSHLITYGTPHAGTKLASIQLLAQYLAGFPIGFMFSDSSCSSPDRWMQSIGVQELVENSSFLKALNARPFPTEVQYTSLIGDAFGAYGCFLGDCIVSNNSQDMRLLPNPPRADLSAVRTVWGKTHVDETSDATSFFWALTRFASAPSAPRSLTAVPGATTVSFAWTPPVSGPVSSYILEAGSASGLSNHGSFDLGSGTAYTATGVGAGTYYVRMKAKNQSGMGPASNEVSFTVGSAVPSRLVGTWLNLDPVVYVQGGVTRITIRNQGNGFLVNLWTTCGFFSECPNGEVPAIGGPAGPLAVRWNSLNPVQSAEVSLTEDGRLSVLLSYHYPNNTTTTVASMLVR
jgi:pimeloyl-ACP methyl ester carboxylesterase